MYTIVSGTNRIGSTTLKVAKEYQRFLQDKGIGAHILSLEGLDLLKRNDKIDKVEQEVIIPSQKIIFISPEYNGSYPGVLKMLFDISPSHSIWWYKKALLTGVASGRGGNTRGMEHLAGVLNYLKISICPELLPISTIHTLMDEDGRFTDTGTIKAINKQLDTFINWYN